jgi:hypothetical protein
MRAGSTLVPALYGGSTGLFISMSVNVWKNERPERLYITLRAYRRQVY